MHRTEDYIPEDFEDDDLDDRECDQDNEDDDNAENVSNCRCGAWIFGKSGKVIHVADCFCGYAD